MMPILLDTHTALWWWCNSPLLSAAARSIIAHEPIVHVSAISAYEVANKYRLGKLGEIGDPGLRFPALMAAHGFLSLAVSENHTLAAGLLPGAHHDPFDRIIAAQALAEGFMVVTCDPELAAFGCKVLW